MPDSSRTARCNAQWSRELIATCLAWGCDHFFVAPGSRSTPLTIWLSQLPSDQVITHFDERGLAFACLGYGRAAGRAGVFVCTSGTAVANALPAVVEASLEHIPMLLLTADRPPELREVGANQSIRQAGIFGHYPVWAFDLPCPTDDIPLSFVHSTAAHACQSSNQGPVHLNCMFREPFVDSSADYTGPLTRQSPPPWRSVAGPGDDSPMTLVGGATLVLAGSGPREQSLAARALADRLGAFFLGDPLGMIHERAWDPGLITTQLPPAQTIIHVGGRIVSHAWHRFLADHPPACYVQFHRFADRLDPSHLSPTFHRLTSLSMLNRIHLEQPCPPGFRESWHRAIEVVHAATLELLRDSDLLSEAGLANAVGQRIPSGHALFLGNSMPIRDVDQFTTWEADRDILVGANRGASGIDGVISSAIGFALGSRRRTTLILGDLSFLHDLNALAMARMLDASVIIIVVNNNGGGIFHFLPIADRVDDFERLFAMPHGLGAFARFAEQFRIPYIRVSDLAAFRSAYEALLPGTGCQILEVPTDRIKNAQHHRWLRSELHTRLASGCQAPAPPESP